MKYAVILLVLLFGTIQSKSTTVDLAIEPLCSEFIISPSVMLLARLVYSEARGEPYLGQLGVAQVVRNRMQWTGKTLEQVIYRKGQFDGIHTKAFHQFPSKQCIIAAMEVLEGGVSIFGDNVLYFLNPDTSTDLVHLNRIEPYFIIRIGRHSFYEKKQS